MLKEIRDIVITGKLKQMETAVRSALDDGYPVGEILNTMRSAMEEIGDRFQRRQIFVPEMLLAAKTMQRGIGVIKPYLTMEQEVIGYCIMGTVEGDLHDVGKNLVILMLEAVGIRVIDLGVDVPPSRFVEALRDHPEVRVVGISALLTTTEATMAATIEAFRLAGLRDRVKIMVGGAPITEEFAELIGADFFSEDASDAAEYAKNYYLSLR